jgi:hypothetical protein
MWPLVGLLLLALWLLSRAPPPFPLLSVALCAADAVDDAAAPTAEGGGEARL